MPFLKSAAQGASGATTSASGAWPLIVVAGGAYLGMALVGVWAAYDRPAAWGRFVLFGLGGVLAFGIARCGIHGGKQALGKVSLVLALVAGGIGAHFLLTEDWAHRSAAKVWVLQQVGLWLQAHRPIAVSGSIHRNAVGGALAIVLPVALAGVAWAWHARYRVVAAIAALAVLLAVAALLLSVSRGAWLGLAAGVLVAGAFHPWAVNPSTSAGAGRVLHSWLGTAVVGALVLVPLAALWFALSTPGLPEAARMLGGSAGESLASRVQLWRTISVMIRDYACTGSGLGVTEMLYSSYVLLLHVPYLSHAHNLVLQTAIEQGVPGLMAFLGLTWLGLRTVARFGPETVQEAWFRTATLAAMVTLLLHGIVDSQLYTSVLVPLMLMPYGFAFAFARARPERMVPSISARWPSALANALGPGLAGLAAAAFMVLPGPRAALQANLGAVAQSRAELAVYHWPEWPIQDAARRSASVDLKPAMERFRAALLLDPDNTTANRRLGQIELSLGHYDEARRYLEVAYADAPTDRATRQLLGETYAIAGEPERAAILWSTIDLRQGQLDLRRGWYDLVNDRERSSLMSRAIALTGSLLVRPPA